MGHTCSWSGGGQRGQEGGVQFCRRCDAGGLWDPGDQNSESSLKWLPGSGTTFWGLQAGDTEHRVLGLRLQMGEPGAGLFAQAGAACVLALWDLVPVCLNLLVSLYGLAAHFAPTWGGAKPNQPPPDCRRPDPSCETAHADVRLAAPVGAPLRLDGLEDRGLGGLLPELHHTADHEHSLPVHPLHHL